MGNENFDKKFEVGDPVFLCIRPMAALPNAAVTEPGKILLKNKFFFRDENIFDDFQREGRFVEFGKIRTVNKFYKTFEYEASEEFKKLIHDRAVEEAERRLLRDPGILKKIAEDIAFKRDREVQKETERAAREA